MPLSEHILITGAGGFISQTLGPVLLSSNPGLILTLADVFEPPIPPSCKPQSSRITCLKADLTSASAVNALVSPSKFTTCYLLHGIMSAGSEADLELGLRVNLDSHRLMLDALRRLQPGVRVIFSSSLAVYGPTRASGVIEDDEVFDEMVLPLPRSSYGSQKFMVEQLIQDYSRKGLIDGRVARLPTVVVRPGKASNAASSFASGIIRESLQGIPNTYPCSASLKMWICAPSTAVHNLALLRTLPSSSFNTTTRVINLPGQTVTVKKMLDALEEVAGKEARGMVKEEREERHERILETWPNRFDTWKAEALGMKADIDVRELIEEFRRSL
ncbi:NAD(P)-binding protein [Aulographum hederae CBS 113979]|uniref:NAD(P)-binding protein n=1 Tax=Aulographum hederae CBS 113979 TaxID=1176131 RepID=A0A6G1GM47_9PEZI|nr:NAD(P)-binding protein [Aulographum hederae CBS 113979]